MRKTIGWIIIFAVFFGLFCMTASVTGIKVSLLIWGSSFFTSGLLILGTILIKEK